MSPRVITETREALEARREAILASLGLTLDGFRSRAETHTLTGEEWEAQEELDEIAFLLGER